MDEIIPCSEQAIGVFVDGVLTESSSESFVDVINPSDGRPCSSIPAGSGADVDRAVSSARNAFNDGRWSEAPPSFRKNTLYQFANLIAKEAGTLDAFDALEMGKPIREAFSDAAAAAALMRFYAESVDKVTGDVYCSDQHSFVTQRRVPRGVIAAVVPWNFPTYVAVLKAAPALAAGNCVVLKPSELSSSSAIRLAHLGLRAGLPPGVLNVVPGMGNSVGRALGLHPDVDMVAFTGSTNVGRWMLQYAGQSNMKVIMAECGGKSPHLVFGDGIDLSEAGCAIARQLLTNQGQICSVGSRLLVERSVEAELIDRITARFAEVVIGNAMDSRTTFGPLASARQCASVMRFIESARADGAEVIAGGRRVLQETGGFFVEPTALRKVSPTARIAQEEIFGPVLTIIPFDTEEEAIRIANGTIYGLASYVWTRDMSRGMRIAKRLRSSVRINSVAAMGEGAGHATSYEPVGQSGVGTEGGLAGMESYLRRQRVWVCHE